MFKYFLKRLAQMLVTLFIVSVLVFVLANFIGDPVNMLVSPKACLLYTSPSPRD